MSDRPNIVLICTDQWRGDCLSIAGHPVVHTPYLDQMALDGVRFTRAYSATPTCIPARAGLYTGQTPRTHGRVGYQDGVPWVYETTLAGELTKAGYQTQAVGKMHVYPERNLVGIELAWGSIRRALRKIGKSGVRNVRLVQADIRIAFDRLFWTQSLHRVYSLFPMPWPKEKHSKHRIFSHAFLKLLNNRLKDRGEVQIVTDHEPYFNWILEQLPETGFNVDSKRNPPVFGTKYERKWREKGQEEFFDLLLLKQENIEIPQREDVTLRTYRVEHFDPDHFNPANERGDIVVEFKEFIYDPKRQKGMVQVIVVEDDLTQNFWIDIDHGEGGWYIHVARGCGALPTVGVQRALDLVHDATCN